MYFDSHAHLVSSDLETYPPNPVSGRLTPGEFDDPMTVERLIAAMDEEGVELACAVQRAHVYGYDNSYTLDSVARFPDRLRAVVVVDPRDPQAPQTLADLVRDRAIAGVRFSAPSFPEAPLDWILSDEAAHAWRSAHDLGLPICVHVLHVQRETVLPALSQRIDELPGATIVVDHVGGAHAASVERSWLASQGKEPGEEFFEPALRLAEAPGVVMKFSDINLEGSLDPVAFVERTVSIFGADRLIWGSDIGQSRAPYRHMWEMARNGVTRLPEEQKRSLLYDNASRIYAGRRPK